MKLKNETSLSNYYHRFLLESHRPHGFIVNHCFGKSLPGPFIKRFLHKVEAGWRHAAKSFWPKQTDKNHCYLWALEYLKRLNKGIHRKWRVLAVISVDPKVRFSNVQAFKIACYDEVRIVPKEPWSPLLQLLHLSCCVSEIQREVKQVAAPLTRP